MDSLKQVEDAIKVALERALPDQQPMDWSARLTGDIGLDSVQIMNLVMEIEDELDMSVPIETLAEVQTLNQLSERLCQLQKPNP
ncbi:MAG TPA: acyl carrier protein [Wenzhouxiangella sp.]|nr:acyl carrier protein [Wenzhouxiangella sp.]